MTLEFWTIGHSTRPPQDLVAALQAHRVAVLADVRRFPHSRRNPAYNADPLRRSLFAGKIRYEYLGDELGGFRQTSPPSPHVALAGSMFQGYADHLESAAFHRGIERLKELASMGPVAYMCSERLPKDCHRKILSDFLRLLEGASIHHILDADHLEEHQVTRSVRVVNGRLLYAPVPLDDFPGTPLGRASKD